MVETRKGVAYIHSIYGGTCKPMNKRQPSLEVHVKTSITLIMERRALRSNRVVSRRSLRGNWGIDPLTFRAALASSVAVARALCSTLHATSRFVPQTTSYHR